MHPSIKESDMLCKLFFQTVHPFICVLHQSLFARELDQYRRGTFIYPRVFEALLFSIYTLTVNSLRADTVLHIFSTSKDVLLARYQYAAQASLTKIDFFKTSKVNGISAILHYTVCMLKARLPELSIKAKKITFVCHACHSHIIDISVSTESLQGCCCAARSCRTTSSEFWAPSRSRTFSILSLGL